MDVADTYRDYARQVAYEQNPPNGAGLAAPAGTSSHGWGLAVDARSACLTWVATHGAAHGWVRTIKAETWHYEYRPALDTHATPAATTATTPEGDDNMFVLIQAQRGHWLIGPGYAHQLNGEEWVESVAKLRDAGIVRVHEFEAGPVGQRRFDLAVAAYTQNARPAAAGGPGVLDYDALAAALVRRMA